MQKKKRKQSYKAYISNDLTPFRCIGTVAPVSQIQENKIQSLRILCLSFLKIDIIVQGIITNHSSFERRSRGVSANEKNEKNNVNTQLLQLICLMMSLIFIGIPVSSARTSFSTCKGHSFRLLCVAFMLCLLRSGVNFWKYNSDGRGITCGGVFLALVVAFDGLFSFFGLVAWRCCHFLYKANIGVIPSTQLIRPECAPRGVTE